MKCQGENCNSIDGTNHSVECLFEHFLSYTNSWRDPSAVMDKLRKAYFDGYEAGVNAQASNTVMDGSDPPQQPLGGADRPNQPEKQNETKETK